MDECASEGCRSPSRWPRPRRRIGFCDTCLNKFAAAQTATMLRPGGDARARFRVRHEPCGAITDVSLPMLHKGWVCQACKLASLTASGWVQGRGSWSLERQEQLMTVAGLRPLSPLLDNALGDQPVNVECTTCGGAQTNSLFGFSEGVRLSWMPCSFCNSQRFKPTAEMVSERFATLGLTLTSAWPGDPTVGLDATCSRCGTQRIVSCLALGSGTPPCLRRDGRRLDPEAPHRVYLFFFPRLGPNGVFKVGITHCVDDRRLAQHTAVGGHLVQVVEVADRATAFAIETTVLRKFQPIAPAPVTPADLPYGGASECWDAFVGHPDLQQWVPRPAVD
ncbi:hypothetical protein [Nocardioides sp. AX2bis]|uniref:hypothetical protein n=1 Tax=Nocardioides sp. AX2bis TaxID=2653157 RepID=UPI0012EF6B99|nr:hypothetical protein [Nocardioides sp. AX2bis]VXC50069.1 conserved hypothetical protein [Nocardioides sp. AX2bis]